MAVPPPTDKNQLKFDSLIPWVPEKMTPPDRGPIEHTFMQMFSLREKFESLMSPTGMAMGEDPFSDARQSVCCIAKMMDSGISRALINLKDETEAMIVDVVTLNDTRVWALPKRNAEPIIFVRYAHHTRDYDNPLNDPVDVEFLGDMIHATLPDNGMVQSVTSASKEEMNLLNKFFQDNAAKMDPDLRAKVEASVDKGLFKIPLSYTSFLTPLTRPDEPPKQVCKVCGGYSKKICTKCKLANYCGRDCQRQDWKAGHRKECKRPEVAAKESRSSEINNNAEFEPWVDVDPRKTPESMHGATATISHINPCMMRSKIVDTRKMASFPGVKRDCIMIVKVQTVLGSRMENYDKMLIYPQGKKFEIDAVPENMGPEKHVSYRLLWMLIRNRGSDAGLGMGGCKAYFDAYVTGDGVLRILIDKMKPLQKW